jgi:hypothetical protein
MTKSHIRSKRTQDKRIQEYEQVGYADRLISLRAIVTDRDASGDDSFRETINSLTPGQVAAALQEEFGTFEPWIVNLRQNAEVLSNEFGEGTFDPKIPKPNDLLMIIK